MYFNTFHLNTRDYGSDIRLLFNCIFVYSTSTFTSISTDWVSWEWQNDCLDIDHFLGVLQSIDVLEIEI